MPHLMVEYTDPLVPEPQRMLAAMQQVLLDSGLFQAADVKGRVARLDTWQAGDGSAPAGFVHARIHVMPGRSEADKRHLSEGVLAAMAAAVQCAPPQQAQLSVEVSEIHPTSYVKKVMNQP